MTVDSDDVRRVINPRCDYADALIARCEEAEARHRNWTFGVIGDEGYPSEIVLTTIEAREVAALIHALRTTR